MYAREVRAGSPPGAVRSMRKDAGCDHRGPVPADCHPEFPEHHSLLIYISSLPQPCTAVFVFSMAAEPSHYLAVLKASYDYEPQADAADEMAIKEDQLLFLLERTDSEYD